MADADSLTVNTETVSTTVFLVMRQVLSTSKVYTIEALPTFAEDEMLVAALKRSDGFTPDEVGCVIAETKNVVVTTPTFGVVNMTRM